jgi:integrase
MPFSRRGRTPQAAERRQARPVGAEIRAVLDGASDRFRPLIAVMLFSGVRIGELLALRWDDVDFDEGAVPATSGLRHGRTTGGLSRMGGLTLRVRLAIVSLEAPLRAPDGLTGRLLRRPIDLAGVSCCDYGRIRVQSEHVEHVRRHR